MEEMSVFFTRRVEGYDEHMLQNVAGCAEGYELLAQNLPENAEDVLDLGCGTGLELDAMLAKRPELRVTGIDLTQATSKPTLGASALTAQCRLNRCTTFRGRKSSACIAESVKRFAQAACS